MELYVRLPTRVKGNSLQNRNGIAKASMKQAKTFQILVPLGAFDAERSPSKSHSSDDVMELWGVVSLSWEPIVTGTQHAVPL
jgi:hypothetical protein